MIFAHPPRSLDDIIGKIERSVKLVDQEPDAIARRAEMERCAARTREHLGEMDVDLKDPETARVVGIVAAYVLASGLTQIPSVHIRNEHDLGRVAVVVIDTLNGLTVAVTEAHAGRQRLAGEPITRDECTELGHPYFGDCHDAGQCCCGEKGYPLGGPTP